MCCLMMGLVFRLQVRERDEGSREETQAEVVVAQHERGAHAIGQALKQNTQALRHSFTESNSTPSNPKPHRSPASLQFHLPGLAAEIDRQPAGRRHRSCRQSMMSCAEARRSPS